VLALELAVKRIGNSSLTLSVRGSARGQQSLRATLTVVLTSIPQMRPVPIPDALRSAMERYREDS
jgi:acyl-CoA thioesterase FadM